MASKAFALLGSLVVLVVLTETAAAEASATIVFARDSGDLFPKNSNVDVSGAFLAETVWSMTGGGVLDAGESFQPQITPSSVALIVHGEFTAKCCGGSWHREGDFNFASLPIGCDDTSFESSGWKATLTLCGKLRVEPFKTEGALNWEGGALEWDGNWEAKRGSISIDPGAVDGSTASITFHAFYDFTAKVRLQGWGQDYRSDEFVYEGNLGDGEITNEWVIRGLTLNAGPAEAQIGDRAPSVNVVLSAAALAFGVLVIRRGRR